jgi:hypothetical protein
MISTLSFNDIKLKNIVIQHIAIIGIGILIFFVEKLEIPGMFWEKLVLLIVSIAKCIYFIEHSFRKIEEASIKNITYNKFLVIILTNVLLIVVSFTVDFTCMMQFDTHSFKGISTQSFLDSVFDFFYFSLASFTTVAYGDIIPITKSAKALTILEVVVAYVTTIIIISNFVHIKESIEKEK